MDENDKSITLIEVVEIDEVFQTTLDSSFSIHLQKNSTQQYDRYRLPNMMTHFLSLTTGFNSLFCFFLS